MIFRNKNIVAAPQILGDPDSITEINNSVANINDDYSVYGHEDVRDALNVVYRDKCCYCERRPESTLQVEHYRPKGRITAVNSTGYYWMGNEWTNLLLACDTCNNKKRSKFPLVNNNHQQNHPVHVNGDLDFAQIPANSGYLDQEDPLIINPSETDPSMHLTINELGHYEAIGVGDYGARTILYLGLNRDSYVYRRQKIIDNVIDSISKLIILRYDPIQPLLEYHYRNLLNDIFMGIVKQTHEREEYNMLGLCMIEKFNEIILEEFEPEFRQEILDYFIDFLEN